jgi:hypothetical protein
MFQFAICSQKLIFLGFYHESLANLPYSALQLKVKFSSICIAMCFIEFVFQFYFRRL